MPLSQSTDPKGTQTTAYGKISTYMPAILHLSELPYSEGTCARTTNSPFYAAKFAHLLGVTQDIAIMNAQGCSATPGAVAGVADRNAPFQLWSVAVFGSQIQTLGNLFNGTEASGRLDFSPNSGNRVYAQYNYFAKKLTSSAPALAPCTRGFTNCEQYCSPAPNSVGYTPSRHIF